MPTANCAIVYEPVAVHFKPLLASGAPNPAAPKYMSDNIIDWDFKSEIEEGKKNVLRCGGRVKNTMQSSDVLTGGTLKISFCCEDPEIQHVVAGSVGMITYDASSPPAAIGFDSPTPTQQTTSVDFECYVYLKVISGSSVTGYKELHFYDCKPTFFDEGGGQDEYPKMEVNIKCVDNPLYTTAMGVMTWKKLATIPTV